MSDLSIALESLARSRTQLPVTSYFDPVLFQREQALIFEHALATSGTNWRCPRSVTSPGAGPGKRRPGAGAHA
jgi:hypothetical protein